MTGFDVVLDTLYMLDALRSLGIMTKGEELTFRFSRKVGER
ncbi:MAG: hypothetical protein ACLU4J_22945 [Butyricimonas paravirosa]